VLFQKQVTLVKVTDKIIHSLNIDLVFQCNKKISCITEDLMVQKNTPEPIIETVNDVSLESELLTAIPSIFNLKLGHLLPPIILVIGDYLALVLALLSSFYLSQLIDSNIIMTEKISTHIYFVIPLIYIGLMVYRGLYLKRLLLWQLIEQLFKTVVFASVIATGLIYFSYYSNTVIPRKFLLLSGVICFIYLLVTRYLTKHLLMMLGLWQKPILLVGAGKSAELIAEAFEEDFYIGYKIIGLIDDNYLRNLTKKYPLLGGFGDVERVIKEIGIQDVIIALPEVRREYLQELVDRIQPLVSNVSILPDLFGLPLNNIDVNYFLKQKTVMLTMRNNLVHTSNILLKRIFDLVVGSIIFMVTLPIMTVLALVIKFSSPGPIFHIAKRIGQNGKEFKCYKFRTMYQDSDKLLQEYLSENSDAHEEWKRFAKLKQFDPRLTKVGKWIRAFSLDELPQIINVLKGEMSLVGPRPYLPREFEKMNKHYNTIILVTPGITGLWQVSGRNEIDFNGRLLLDSWYVRNWSFWLDVTLLLKTVKVVFTRKGAY